MDVESRQEAILKLLREQEHAGAEQLAQAFAVSIQTIRSDLRELANVGLVDRTRGGARHVISASNRAYGERRKQNAAQKEQIGVLAALLIPDNCSIILNIGTTTEQVARALADHRDLIVLSNNINIINTLMGTPSKELILVGGSVRQSDGAIVGQDAVESISRYKADFAVIGASAMDADGSVLDYDAREVSVARAILRNARTTILVSDHSKFERSAPVRICDIAELDYFITDTPPPAEFIEAAKKAQTEILTLDDSHDDATR